MTVRELVDRFGATMAVIATLVLLVVLLPEDTDGDVEISGGAGTFSADSDTVPDDPVSSGTAASREGDGLAAGQTGGQASTVGSGATGGDATSTVGEEPATGSGGGSEEPVSSSAGTSAPTGAECRPSDGRQPGISLAMPPCVPRFAGDNGGATARGVTRDEIIVARYVPQQNAAVNATLTAAGIEDSPEKIKDIYNTLRRYSNHHYETYGREVVFVDVEASGPADNEEAMRADAIRIAEDIGAFAAIERSGSSVLPEELARRDVHAIGYATYSRRFHERLPPRIWSQQPTPESAYQHAAEYIGKRLARRNAIHAGDDEDPTGLQNFREEPRKFGLVWIEGNGSRVDPYAKPARDYFVRELEKYGVSLAAEASYTFDLARQQQQAANIISKMRSEDVSNVILYTDPLYPIYLTQEATRQNYFPEWLMTGSLLVDTTFFGRTYDQRQWQNAFGFSTFWVFPENVSAWAGTRAYHHMKPEAEPGDEGGSINNLRWDVQHLFIGIHLAGPNLTPETFAEGMLGYPATGGVPGLPLIDYTRRDPSAFKDMVEAYWDAEATGEDEVGQEGVGILLKVNQGKRYEPGEWPNTPPEVFDPEGTIYTSDNPPGGQVYFPHEDDGHRHPADGCRSCS